MSKSQDRRVAVQREADPIARLRAVLGAATPGPWVAHVGRKSRLGEEREAGVCTAWGPGAHDRYVVGNAIGAEGRHEPLDMDALTAEARRIAALLDVDAHERDEQYRHVASALQNACTMGAISLARYRNVMRSLRALHGDDAPDGEP